MTGSSGLDPSGLDAVIPEATSYGEVGGTWYAQSQQSGGTVYYSASSPAGPWTQIGETDFHTYGIPGASDQVMNVSPGVQTQYLAIGSSSGSSVIYPPSGDKTGAADAAAINALLSQLFAVQLTPGTYYVNAPLELRSYGVLKGTSRPSIQGTEATTIMAVGALPFVVGSYGWRENISNGNGYISGAMIRDLKVDANGTASNCITWQAFDSQIIGGILRERCLQRDRHARDVPERKRERAERHVE